MNTYISPSRRSLRALIVGAFTVWIAACSGSSPTPSAGPSDAGAKPGPDSASLATQVGFDADKDASDATMYLAAGEPVDEGTVTVDVVIAPQPRVYGVAGAIDLDTEAVKVVKVESLQAIEGPSGVFAWRQTPKGRLVFAVSRRGPSSGAIVSSKTHVVRMTLRLMKSHAATVRFVPKLCAVVGDHLEPVVSKPSFAGGKLQSHEVQK